MKWALVALLAAGVPTACEDDGPSAPGHRHTVATVQMRPASMTLSTGATGYLTASARCGCGAGIAETFTWTTDDASVATVSASGIVRAVGFGTTTIHAVAEGVEATGTLTVLPRGTVIGADGGTVTSPDGRAVLEVPAGALAVPTDVVIEALDEWPFLLEPFYIPGTAYGIEPWGAELQTAARLRIRYDPANVPEGVDPARLRLEELVLWDWEEAEEQLHRVQTHEVEGDVTFFATFALFAIPNGVVLGPPGGLIAASDGSWELEVPPGALDDWVEVEVTPAVHAIYPFLPTYVEGTGWAVKPDGLQLHVPARLRIRYDPASVPAVVDPDRLVLMEFDRIYPRFNATLANRANRAEHWVEGGIDRFWWFAVLGELALDE